MHNFKSDQTKNSHLRMAGNLSPAKRLIPFHLRKRSLCWPPEISRGCLCQRQFQGPAGRKEPSSLLTKPWVSPFCQRRAQYWQPLWCVGCRWLHETSAVKSQHRAIQSAEAHPALSAGCAHWMEPEKEISTLTVRSGMVAAANLFALYFGIF